MQNCKKCQVFEGWRVVKTSDIDIPKAKLVELEHDETGASYVHLTTESKENVFCVAFKTVPNNSTGVAHILEHLALAGSEKYPLRDPFFNMLKRSLQTFMNAFTSSDWTAYPFASPNQKDFYNLMSLYLDASFFPRLDKLNFMQEGWRYAFDGEDLRYDGVVFNEMKGATSSVNSLLAQAIFTSLYQNAPYHFNTGGEPEDITKLKHEELLAFHKKHYHPSNAFFFSMGNNPLAKNISMINENVLKKFKRSKRIEVQKENRWSEAKKFKAKYPVNSEEDMDKHHVALAWLMSPVQENLEVFSLEILEDILLGNTASPLKRALLDSGLGSDLVAYSGYDSEPLDTCFHVGLKDVCKKDIPKVRGVIFDCLQSLLESGIDEDLIESVISSNEARKRHISNADYPYGIQVFLNIAGPWIHGGDVKEALDFESLVKRLREKVAAGGYFEALIKRHFIDNHHLAEVVLEPDIDMVDRLDDKEKKKLQEIKEGLKKEQLEEIRLETKRLEDLQQKEEDMSCLPDLEISDIDKEIVKASKKEGSKGLGIYIKNTNKLLYMSGKVDIGDFDVKDKRLFTLYTFLWDKMGTKNKDFEKLSRQIDRLSGGISFNPLSIDDYHSGGSLELLSLNSYGLKRNVLDLFSLIAEMMSECSLEDIERIKKLAKVLESKYRASVVSQGFAYASSKAASVCSSSLYGNEAFSGLDQLEFLNKVLKDAEGDFVSHINELKRINEQISKRRLDKLVLISETDELDDYLEGAKEIYTNKDLLAKENIERKNLKLAYETSTNVSFVASVLKAAKIDHPDAPALSVAAKILGRGYFHKEIREKGGAYGGFIKYKNLTGELALGSFRDPYIERTLEVFSGAPKAVEQIKEKEIKEAIIAVSAENERRDTEVEDAKKIATYDLMGVSEETRRKFREDLLKIKKEEVVEVAKKYLKDDWRDYSCVIISSKEKIKRFKQKEGKDFVLKSI